MGNYCCSQRSPTRQRTRTKPVRSKSLKDPSTKKQYQKTLEYILNQALQKFQEEYEIKSLKLKGLLGKGGQACVFQVDVLCQKNNQTLVKKYAMKRVSKHRLDRQRTRQALLLEKEILVTSSSPFITQIEFACQDDAYLYFFMKLAQGGDSFSLIKDQQILFFTEEKNIDKQSKAKQFKKLGENGIIFILAAVILGLQSLHKLNIIYRDLKPENILLFQDGYPKLADFGVALKHQDQDQLFYEMKGTVLYFAPQMMSKKGYDKGVDLWALGVLAYQFIFKQPPFSAHIIQSTLFQRKIQQRLQKYQWPKGVVSNEMKSFINSLLVEDPKKRLGYNNFDEIKKHSVFKQINWKQFQKRKLKSPLTEIIRKYPVQIKKEKEIDEIIDHSELGYIPFTFVRTAEERKPTLDLASPTFIIDSQMRIQLTRQSQTDFSPENPKNNYKF